LLGVAKGRRRYRDGYKGKGRRWGRVMDKGKRGGEKGKQREGINRVLTFSHRNYYRQTNNLWLEMFRYGTTKRVKGECGTGTRKGAVIWVAWGGGLLGGGEKRKNTNDN